MSNIIKTFAENVRKYRKKANLTQESLAEKSKLHRTYIGGIEQQRINVSLKNLEKIAEALDVDPMMLLMKESDKLAEKSKNLSATPIETNATTQGKREYLICIREGNSMTFNDIDVENENLTLGILCSLINMGYADDLADAYNNAQSKILEFLRSDYAKQQGLVD